MSYLMQDYFQFSEVAKIYEDLTADILDKLKQLPYEIIPYENQDLDYLAYQYYKDEQLWWVLAYVNDILSPLEIKKDILIVPYKQDLLDLLSSHKEKTQ